jgi:hypothetical protein
MYVVETWTRLKDTRCCLPIPQKLHNVTIRLKTTKEVEQYFPSGFLAFVDCTEQPMPKSKNKLRRRLYYSFGKRNKHTHGKEPAHYKSKHRQIGRW